jgi:seipin
VDLATTGMLGDQPYATFVELELPRSKNNLELGISLSYFTNYSGNFMVSLSLLNSANATLATSARPAILTYTSPLISTSLTVLNSPFLITGFKKESETLLVPVMERFEFGSSRASRPRYAFIEIIPDSKIHVYSAKLMFVAQFEGVR